jgi:hypothetical protein
MREFITKRFDSLYVDAPALAPPPGTSVNAWRGPGAFRTEALLAATGLRAWSLPARLETPNRSSGPMPAKSRTQSPGGAPVIRNLVSFIVISNI